VCERVEEGDNVFEASVGGGSAGNLGKKLDLIEGSFRVASGRFDDFHSRMAIQPGRFLSVE
jgi:hypothetical protein